MKQEIDELPNLILELKEIQNEFFGRFGVSDIFSNSKIFEIIIANNLGHILIPGHAGSRDAKDEQGNEYEYKHYKESSSNHTWTFNDYSDTTINKLKNVKSVIFAHIDDSGNFPVFDWCYGVPGPTISDYLSEKVKPIKNHRKMINVSARQIEMNLGIEKTMINYNYREGTYYSWLKKIIDISCEIENRTGTKEVMTSNKFWEILVAKILGHTVLSEQLGHDAVDTEGNYYEYKVAKNHSWNFQDISNAVLDKYKNDKEIILATVDKENCSIDKIYSANSDITIKLLKQKLRAKKIKYRQNNKPLRRLSVSISKGDLKRIDAKLIYNQN